MHQQLRDDRKTDGLNFYGCLEAIRSVTPFPGVVWRAVGDPTMGVTAGSTGNRNCNMVFVSNPLWRSLALYSCTGLEETEHIQATWTSELTSKSISLRLVPVGYPSVGRSILIIHKRRQSQPPFPPRMPIVCNSLISISQSARSPRCPALSNAFSLAPTWSMPFPS